MPPRVDPRKRRAPCSDQSCGGPPATRCAGADLEIDDWEGRHRRRSLAGGSSATACRHTSPKPFYGATWAAGARRSTGRGPLGDRVTDPAGEGLAQQRVYAAVDDEDAAWIERGPPRPDGADARRVARARHRRHRPGCLARGLAAIRDGRRGPRCAVLVLGVVETTVPIGKTC